ncbi:hypothetical protein H2248_005982 [Termitomyces sp. 'cryptogamus']|nr:hypothetical protein H2248_005982 [Termitomyces sp. 'cryptogamus']
MATIAQADEHADQDFTLKWAGLANIQIRQLYRLFVSGSMGFSPFHLKTGQSPHLIPPLIPTVQNLTLDEVVEAARKVLKQLDVDVTEAKDNLLQAKIAQAAQANKHHADNFVLKVSD